MENHSKAHEKQKFTQNLVLAPALFSIWNIIVYFVNFVQLESTLSLSTWALLPQLLCTYFLLKMYLNSNQSSLKMRETQWIFLTWLTTNVLNLLAFFIPEKPLWPIWKCILSSLGYPFGNGTSEYSPFKSHFYAYDSKQSDLLKKSIYVFDGGVMFSWLFFNMTIIALLLFFMRKRDNLESLDFSKHKINFCPSCGDALSGYVKFCSKCGNPIQSNFK